MSDVKVHHKRDYYGYMNVPNVKWNDWNHFKMESGTILKSFFIEIETGNKK